MAKKTKKKVADGSKQLKKTKEEMFCVLFASDREFMGNGVQSYLEAYDPKVKPGYYKVAQNAAHRLLTKAIINSRIAFLIEAELNDLQVDKQLSFMVAQNADLKVKLGAVKEYNALKQRVINRMEHTGKDGKAIEFNISVTKTYKDKNADS
ncbi:MAG: hypothetical protein JRE23_18550 [Deltaproteobacteria bacterium]|nr:hypothetical protein [Deltaproteobacteria bacterium]